jgi:hypothetical protein
MQKNKKKGGNSGGYNLDDFKSNASDAYKYITNHSFEIFIQLSIFCGFSLVVLLLFWFITAINSDNIFTITNQKINEMNNIK